MTRVFLPGALLSYTGSKEAVAEGGTLDEVLMDLDRQFPGLRFRLVDEQDRIRRHIRVFVNGEQSIDLAAPLNQTNEIYIVQALSGG